MRIDRTKPENPDFASLVARLTAFLSVLNGENDSFYAPLNKVDDSLSVVVAYLDENPVGCGAIRPMDPKTVEVKRMFVDPNVRGTGIGRAILQELELWATEKGFETAILETSVRLEPAVGLYKSAGYAVIPNYGAYVGVIDSVCFEKQLG